MTNPPPIPIPIPPQHIPILIGIELIIFIPFILLPIELIIDDIPIPPNPPNPLIPPIPPKPPNAMEGNDELAVIAIDVNFDLIPFISSLKGQEIINNYF